MRKKHRECLMPVSGVVVLLFECSRCTHTLTLPPDLYLLPSSPPTLSWSPTVGQLTPQQCSSPDLQAEHFVMTLYTSLVLYSANLFLSFDDDFIDGWTQAGSG